MYIQHVFYSLLWGNHECGEKNVNNSKALEKVLNPWTPSEYVPAIGKSVVVHILAMRPRKRLDFREASEGRVYVISSAATKAAAPRPMRGYVCRVGNAR